MKTISKLERITWLLWLLLLQDVDANFKCPAAGRYLDILSDCERFFFCYENNGEIFYETFKCPEGRLYSVEERRCITASNLQCKEFIEATFIPTEFEKVDLIEEFTCRGEGKFVNYFDRDCNSFITCTRTSGQSYSMNLQYCSSGEKFSHYSFECVPNDQFQCPTTHLLQNETSLTPTTITSEDFLTTASNGAAHESHNSVSVLTFECTSTGRFPNSEEPGCTTYIMCVAVNGTFLQNIFNCTESSLFDPNTGRCSLDYVCQDNTTPMPGTTADESSTIAENFSTFECTSTGRFPNSEEPGCTSYIMCVAVNGTFSHNIFNCTGSSLFDPNAGTCSLDYVCPDSTTPMPGTTPDESSTITENFSTFECTSTGRFPNSEEPGCTSYIMCVAVNGTFSHNIFNCTGSSLFDPNAGICSLDYVCPDSTTPMPGTTADESSTITEIFSTFECTSTGRFSNAEEPGCTSYIMCVPVNGTILPFIYTCTGSSLFDPNSGKCSLDYVCPDNTKPMPRKTAVESFKTAVNVLTFECTSTGRFPNLEEPGCTSYIQCVEINGTILPYLYICTSSFFDPNAKACSPDYVCTDNTTPMPGTSEDDSSTTDISVDFDCPRSGRYPNTAQPGCKNYIFCKGSEPFNVSIIWCNGTDLYSPERGRCVPSSEYTCPDESSTTTNEITTDPSHSTPLDTVCTSIGYFPNLEELGCATYILCAKDQSGIFISAIKYCDNSLFDPDAGRCSLDYVCPDNTTPMPETIPVDFDCPRSGRYPNTAQPGCKNYIFCKGSEPFDISIISCNGTDLYSPDHGRCVPSSEYTCPDESSTTTNEITADPSPPDTVCTSIGRFPNVGELGCATYILCAEDQNGAFVSAIKYCDNSLFDPNAGGCSLEYVCPDNTTPMPPKKINGETTKER